MSDLDSRPLILFGTTLHNSWKGEVVNLRMYLKLI